jgi:ABC-type spermidine/putrescine transport system permease subunit II
MPAKPSTKPNPSSLYHRLVVYLLFLILLLPLAGTLLYSLATNWSASLLPSGLTLKWYVALWSEPRFLAAFGQSLRVANSTPMVDLLSRLNSLRVKRERRLDLPTPESPMRTTLKRNWGGLLAHSWRITAI